ncbi:MAG: hypothetical protein RMJ07_06350 [Nitrososphaerota archaeon]|nr:hypothetical protein [Candidatus Bathyarchaeota archaeon]MDW8049277.1 hypothetical protein [Nitrososphaerota archaeon]
MCKVYARNGSSEDFSDRKPPVETVARLMLRAVPLKYEVEFGELVDMLREVPTEIPRGERAVVTKMKGDFVIELEVVNKVTEGVWWGWDFYWRRYWCQGDFVARTPNAIGICFNTRGEITFFYTAMWFTKFEIKGEVKVMREEAYKKAFEYISSNMKWIGVTGLNWTSVIAVLKHEKDLNPSTIGEGWPNPGNYYPCWVVEARYDEMYVTPNGEYWIIGYVVGIRADTAELIYHHMQGVYGPPPSYKEIPLTEDELLLDEVSEPPT